MGILGRFERSAPPTATDFVEPNGNVPGTDAEKATTGIQEDVNAPTPQQHVLPDAERAVVRKLDWRIPPLLAVLCMEKKYRRNYSN